MHDTMMSSAPTAPKHICEMMGAVMPQRGLRECRKLHLPAGSTPEASADLFI
jgi:hypothetical protein